MSETVWIVGQMHKEDMGIWTMEGVFEFEDEAISRCNNVEQFVAPFTIGDYMEQGFLRKFYYPMRAQT